MTKQIFAAEITLEDLPLAARNKFATTESAINGHLSGLSTHVEEVYILSCTTRFAIYIVDENVDALVNFFKPYVELFQYVRFYKSTERAMQHLFATASGLLSPVRGDRKILNEINRAYEQAIACGSVGMVLDHALNEAFRVGKMVRTETGIDQFCSSMVDAGLSIVYDRLDDMYNRIFLVMGTDAIARTAITSLKKEGLHNIIVAAPTQEEATALAVKYGVKGIQIANAYIYLVNADVVLSCAQNEPALHNEVIEDLCNKWATQKATKKIVLDFGMLQPFNNIFRRQPDVSFFSLDEIKSLCSSPFDAFGGIGKAWEIVMHQTAEFLQTMHKVELTPILRAHWNKWVTIHEGSTNSLVPNFQVVSVHDVALIKREGQQLVRNIVSKPFKHLNIVSDVQASDGEGLARNIIKFSNIRLFISNH